VVKAGLIQTKTYSTNSDGIKKVAKILERLGKKETEIVCLPEQWLAKNEINDFDAEFLDFKKIAKEYHMTIISGAFYKKSKKDVKIISSIIGPEGEIIGNQEKIHPFDYEKKRVVPGKEAKIFNTSCKFGVVICYDMVFPRVAETFVKKGAHILFSPSRIVKRGISPWQTYVQARSLENRIPIIAANVKNSKFGGESMIVDLIEKDRVMIPKITYLKEEGCIVKQVDLTKFEKSRKIRFSDSRKFF